MRISRSKSRVKQPKEKLLLQRTTGSRRKRKKERILLINCILFKAWVRTNERFPIPFNSAELRSGSIEQWYHESSGSGTVQ